MKKLFKVFLEKIKRLFSFKKKLGSSEQVHWVNHIYDKTKLWPDGHLHWGNVHGFDEGPGIVYWVGFDFRYMGIRIEDYVLKCKNKSTYDEYVNACLEDVWKKLKVDSRFVWRRGGDVNTEFIFKWGDDDKSFDVHLDSDIYAEEQ